MKKNNRKQEPSKPAAGGKNMSNQEASQIITKLVKVFKDRSKKDIQKWRTAITLAESPTNPNRWKLMDIYNSTVIDCHLTSVMRSRDLKLLGSAFKIRSKKTQDMDEEKTGLLKKTWFREYTEYWREADYYGFSAVQFDLPVNGEFKSIQLVPREHVLPDKTMILIHPADVEGIDFTEAPFSNWFIGMGKKKNLGLLMKATPQEIFKRNAQSAWARFSEIFGIPLRTATTTSRNQKDIDLINQMLEEMGEASHAVFPEGTSLTVHEVKGNDAYNVFDKQMERADQQMSKLIFGQTSTADSSAGKFKADVHDELSDDYTLDDCSAFMLHVNDILLPFLAMHGYPFTDDDEFYFSDEKELSIQEKADIDLKISQMGWKPTKDYIENTYGTELEDAPEPVLPPDMNPPDPNNPAPGNPLPKGKKKKGADVQMKFKEIKTLYV